VYDMNITARKLSAIILSHSAESIGVELLLREVGFAINNPKTPSLRRVLEAAPDLIVVDWEPSEETKNTTLVEEIRKCSATANIPILISASALVSERVSMQPKLVVLHFGVSIHSALGALKLLGFRELALSWQDQQAKPANDDRRMPCADASIERLCARFPIVVRQLRQRRAHRPTLEVMDEYDVQSILQPLLRIFFDDVRPEEVSPSYAGGSARMDFLLKKEHCVLEIKIAREGLGAREVGSQLIEDIARYRAHQDCRKLFCLVYDPGYLINNPRGLETDLAGIRDGLEVKVMIVPKEM
jgi:hypothetical protein